jgi:hypothetical protein
MDVFVFERLDSVEMPENSGAFPTLEKAVEGVQHSYRSRPSGDFNDVMARQDFRLFFRQREVDGGWLVEVFPNEIQLEQPLATYRIRRGQMADSAPNAE